jgi:CubicO group peptidase (beta-lactamase class C family)
MSAQRSLHARARRTLPFLLSFLLSLAAIDAQGPKPAPAARTATATPAPAPSTALPTAKPEDVGVSSERLERLDRTVQQYVDQGKVAGVVTLIARKGQIVQYGAYGKRDVESGAPMAKDSIFRIASMSKAITSVAIMILMEDGKLTITDPVSKFIPQFKSTTVAAEYRDGTAPPTARPLIVNVPAKRQVTIRDLLTHTSGVSYGDGPAEDQYKAANIYSWYFADKSEPIGPIIERLAALPFNAQPGEKYVYGFNTDILGAVVEKASGLTLDEFLRTRIFTPLKMTDTHFFLPPEKRDRLVTVYGYTPAGKLERAANPGKGQGEYVDGPRATFSGGAGLLSTASDYSRFLQMLLNGGELDGARVLSPKTVELMTSNHVGDLYQQGKFGFGLGFEITEHVGRSGRPGSVGEFGWGGAYHTQMWVDPQEQLVVVYMTQTLPSGPLDLQPRFRALLYSSLLGAPTKKLPAPSAKPAATTTAR